MSDYSEVKVKARALLKEQSTESLVQSLKMLERMLAVEPDKDKASDFRLSRAWIADELEERFPEAIEAIDAWIADRDNRSYFEVLLGAVAKSLWRSNLNVTGKK